MSGTTASSAPRRSRRRLTAWLAFAAVGVTMGAVWATGFETVGGQAGANTSSPALTSSNPAMHTADLNGLVAAGSPLTVDWAGRWGSTSATKFFTIDLTGQSASNNYNVAMLLTNDISGAGWTTLQLKLELQDVGSGTCSASDFDGTGTNKLMAFDSQDAGAYWNGLAGGKRYCIGVAQSNDPADDMSGTFLRRDSDTVDPSTYPQFVTTVDRAS
jgi:hypothetical protein